MMHDVAIHYHYSVSMCPNEDGNAGSSIKDDDIEGANRLGGWINERNLPTAAVVITFWACGMTLCLNNEWL